MQQKTIIFVGRSGCGKGTQSELLKQYLEKNGGGKNVYYLESGANFRDFVVRDNHTSRLALEVSKKGALQPEFLAVWVWSHLMIENLKGDEHLVIDGTPRKLHEAEVLDSAMRFYSRTPVDVVYVNVSRDWSRERMVSRGRGDDNKDDIEARLNWFDTDVVPAIEFFRDSRSYNFHEINGEQSVEKVHEDIVRSIFNDQ